MAGALAGALHGVDPNHGSLLCSISCSVVCRKKHGPIIEINCYILARALIPQSPSSTLDSPMPEAPNPQQTSNLDLKPHT